MGCFGIPCRKQADPLVCGNRSSVHRGDVVIDWTYSGNKLPPTQKPLLELAPFDPFCPGGVEIDPAMYEVGTRPLAGVMARQRAMIAAGSPAKSTPAVRWPELAAH